MMQRYYSSQGQCYSCGMMFHHCICADGAVLDQSPSVVDCTLSLGTPSTRLCEEENEKRRRSVASSSSSSSCMSNFWDLLHTKNNAAKTAPFSASYHSNYQKTIARGNNGNDPLLARRCANCDTTSTPLWRNGPRGPKSLCNACGIRFKKEEKRTTTANGGASPAAGVAEQNQHQHQHHYHHHANNYINYPTAAGSWVNNHAPTQRVAHHAPIELQFVDDVGDRESDSGAVPFLSWRLNVADRASLVHDFIR